MLARAEQVEESLRSDPDATQTAPSVRQEHTPLEQVMSPLCCRIGSSLQHPKYWMCASVPVSVSALLIRVADCSSRKYYGVILLLVAFLY